MLNSSDFIDLWSVLQEEFEDVLMSAHYNYELLLILVKLKSSFFIARERNGHSEVKECMNVFKVFGFFIS